MELPKEIQIGGQVITTQYVRNLEVNLVNAAVTTVISKLLPTLMVVFKQKVQCLILMYMNAPMQF